MIPKSSESTAFLWIRLDRQTDRQVDFPGGSVVKNPSVNVRIVGSILGLGRSPGEGNDNPCQYSCQENFMDRGAWQATVHGVTRVR